MVGHCVRAKALTYQSRPTPELTLSAALEVKNIIRASVNSCDPETAMKIFLGIVAVLVVAASVVADYKWRQWMAARRRDRQ
jgi:hypothetical protein